MGDTQEAQRLIRLIENTQNQLEHREFGDNEIRSGLSEALAVDMESIELFDNMKALKIALGDSKIHEQENIPVQTLIQSRPLYRRIGDAFHRMATLFPALSHLPYPEERVAGQVILDRIEEGNLKYAAVGDTQEMILVDTQGVSFADVSVSGDGVRELTRQNLEDVLIGQNVLLEIKSSMDPESFGVHLEEDGIYVMTIVAEPDVSAERLYQLALEAEPEVIHPMHVRVALISNARRVAPHLITGLIKTILSGYLGYTTEPVNISDDDILGTLIEDQWGFFRDRLEQWFGYDIFESMETFAWEYLRVSDVVSLARAQGREARALVADQIKERLLSQGDGVKQKEDMEAPLNGDGLQSPKVTHAVLRRIFNQQTPVVERILLESLFRGSPGVPLSPVSLIVSDSVHRAENWPEELRLLRELFGLNQVFTVSNYQILEEKPMRTLFVVTQDELKALGFDTLPQGELQHQVGPFDKLTFFEYQGSVLSALRGVDPELSFEDHQVHVDKLLEALTSDSVLNPAA